MKDTKINKNFVSGANQPETPQNPTPDAVSTQESLETMHDHPQESQPTINVVNANSLNTDGGGKKTAFAIMAITILIIGVITGVFLIGRNNLQKSKAWDCSKYTFELDENGQVIVKNLSNRNEPPQQARVIINSQEVAIFDVPALASGDTASLGNVQLPAGSYSWKIVGTVDCSNSGSHEQEITARCEIIKAYDTEGNLLNLDELSALPEGSMIRFTVLGSANEGIFDKAKFIINDISQEVTNKNEAGEFYIDYQIPEGANTIKVDAQVHHSTLDNWY